jgi:LacI family transcriptional regulator
MSTKASSIKDIAKKANVSITTVSFILNGKAVEKNISAAVIKRVEDIIEADGYKPNQVARSLRTGNSHIIGLIVEDIANPFFAGIARMLEDRAYKKGYKILYSSTENKASKTSELINLFKSRQVDAYIIAPALGAEKDIQGLINEGKPVVLFDRYLPELDVNYVGIDNFDASHQAAENFIESGKKHLALVTVDLEIEQIKDREAGFRHALTEAGIKEDQSVILKVPFGNTREETIELLVGMLSAHPKIDAILFATNYLAISGLLAIKKTKKVINKHLSVIAYDDGDIFKLHTPQISALEQPLEEIADRIIKKIFEQLGSKMPVTIEKTILPAKLLLR